MHNLSESWPVDHGGGYGLLFMPVAAVRNREQSIFPYFKGAV